MLVYAMSMSATIGLALIVRYDTYICIVADHLADDLEKSCTPASPKPQISNVRKTQQQRLGVYYSTDSILFKLTLL